jgi:hypothetical protein
VALDLDRPCPHEEFDASVDVGRISDVEGGPIVQYSATMRVWCKACQEPMVWIGVDPGLSPRGPRMSIDAQSLVAPCRPETSPADFGLDGPGFDVRRVI